MMGNLIFPLCLFVSKKYFFSSFKSFLSRSPIQIFQILESFSETLSKKTFSPPYLFAKNFFGFEVQTLN